MIKLLFLIYLIQLSKAAQHYDYLTHRLKVLWPGPNGQNMKPPRLDVFDRITLLSRQIYEDAIRRVLEINEIRDMYEESQEYECGYIMGEIIERYRKLMEEGRMVYANLRNKYRPFKHSFPGLLNRLEKAQQLYLEEYHLVRMMHEIIPKYRRGVGTPAEQKRQRNKASAKPPPKYDHDRHAKMRKEAAEERERKRREKMAEKNEELLAQMNDRQNLKNKKKFSYYNYSTVHKYTVKPTKTRPKKGVLDYGWDIGLF